MAQQWMDLKEKIIDISHFLRSHQISVPAQELEKPRLPVVARVYEWLVRELTQCPENVFYQLSFSAAQELEYPDMFEKAMKPLHLCLALEFLLGDVGYPEDFFLADLFTPNREKNAKMMFRLCEFHIARSACVPHVEKFLNELKNQEEEMRQYMVENESLKARINSARLRLGAEEANFIQVQERAEQVKQQFADKTKMMQEVNQNSGRLENELKQREERLKATMKILDRKRQEAFNLKSQIFRSPERLPKEVKDLESEKEELTEEINRLNTETMDNDEKYDKDLRTEAFLNSIMVPLNQLSIEKEQLDGLKAECRKAEGEMMTKRALVDGAKTKLNSKRKMLDNSDAKMKNTMATAESRNSELEKDLSQLRKDLVREKHTNAESAIVDDACDEIREEMQRLDRDFADFERTVETNYGKLETEVMAYRARERQHYAQIKENLRKQTKDF